MKTRLGLPLSVALAGLLAAQAAGAFPWSPDMRRSPGLRPQRKILMPADSTVPRTGKVDFGLRREAADRLVNPVPRTPAAEAAGKATFDTFCFPCHGPAGRGDGPVAAKFPGVANLTQPLTQGRSDGYIYVYIRHGGILMPSYGFGVKPHSAWEVVHYVRKLQGK
ncbi:MAG TPA: cytochrome c [Candidatus Saccharimonadales bacterium]|nr:cytochrome c [Candidatus Saccharimonadales bacterium]